MRREERLTVQEQQPDGMSHRGLEGTGQVRSGQVRLGVALDSVDREDMGEGGSTCML